MFFFDNIVYYFYIYHNLYDNPYQNPIGKPDEYIAIQDLTKSLFIAVSKTPISSHISTYTPLCVFSLTQALLLAFVLTAAIYIDKDLQKIVKLAIKISCKYQA